MRHYAEQISQHIDNLHEPQADVIRSTSECLACALEELNVAQEELELQNQQLATACHQLEAERRKYWDLFEFAPDGYLITTLDGTIQQANRAAAALLKLDQKSLSGKPLVVFVPEELRRSFRFTLLQVQEMERLQNWELCLKPRDGKLFDAALTVVVVPDPENQQPTLRWLLRDVTERRQAEAQIRRMQIQNAQMAESLRLRSQFLTVMSHELRTPMNAIIGFSQLLVRQFHHSLFPEQANLAERILKNGRNLMALINDVLALSQLEGGLLELKPSAFDLAEMVADTVRPLQSLAEQKQLDLVVDVSLNDPWITNDRDRVQQILINLLSNAIKFTEKGCVRLSVWEVDRYRLAIAVSDTGIGIAPEHHESIFQEFWQLNQTLSRQHNGTGLGLSITQRLVELMRGNIAVESELGTGTVFRVELPRRLRSRCLN